MANRLSSASFAYPAVKSEARADLARLLAKKSLDGIAAFTLSTCLRLEVAVPGDQSHLDATLAQLFGEAADTPGVVIRHDAEAALHLFRIAAGLESPVIGEREIWTQCRQALADSKLYGLDDGLFLKLLENAVHTGKTARELLPQLGHESLAAVAAQLVGPSDQVAVFGSGEIATAVMYALARLPSPPEVVVAARHPERVKADDVAVVPFERAGEILGSHPAVISATSAKTRLVDEQTLHDILLRRTTPLVLVDMAMPPDFSPPEGAPITYIDIDTLARKAARSARSDAADEHVREAALQSFRRMSGNGAGTVIRELMGNADGLVDRAVGRFAGRLSDPNDAEVLRHAAHTVARSLLAAPVGFLNQADGEAVEVIAAAFGIDD